MSKHAIIKTGGKQYRVAEGQFLKLETLPGEPGSSIQFDNILLISDGDTQKIGTPTVSGAKVSADIVEHGRHKKVHILKFKRRKHHMKQMGHRQNYTQVKITAIEG